MQHQETNATLVSPAVEKPAPADLLQAIPGMTVTINRQELTELKKALQEPSRLSHALLPLLLHLPQLPALVHESRYQRSTMMSPIHCKAFSLFSSFTSCRIPCPIERWSQHSSLTWVGKHSSGQQSCGRNKERKHATTSILQALLKRSLIIRHPADKMENGCSTCGKVNDLRWTTLWDRSVPCSPSRSASTTSYKTAMLVAASRSCAPAVCQKTRRWMLIFPGYLMMKVSVVARRTAHALFQRNSWNWRNRADSRLNQSRYPSKQVTHCHIPVAHIFSIKVVITYGALTWHVSALLDSGTASCFITATRCTALEAPSFSLGDRPI